jgi:outer membrane protein OmpA-like peptidoglycan-associated protein
VASPILATDPQTNVEIKPEPPVVTASLNPVVESEKSSKVKDTDVATNPFMFKIVRATDQKVLTGEIELIDAAKAKKIMTYEGNKPVEVKVPQNADAEFLVVCKAFGYRKEQRSLKISKPEGEGISIDESGVTTVPFELVRLHKGDIAVMYNVYFFNDAAVMRPESNYELNTLVEMMEENSNCKIKIHGHTNGGAHGKIIYMGDEKNFFSLTGSTSGFGSAKKLSNARAQVIKDYLVSKGIEESRIAVKAWGGKRPLHDKHHTRASENARVEVEIMAD